MSEPRKGCPVCGQQHTYTEPCSFATRCRGCGTVIRLEAIPGVQSLVCNECFRREREGKEKRQ